MKKFAIPALASALALAACAEPVDETTTAEPEATEAVAAEPAGTIVEVASGNEDFSTLVAAVGAADLAETLSGEGPFTVFAPTNAAFEKLPEGTVDGLLKPEAKDDLTGILTYHVVSGKTMAEALDAAILDGRGKAELTTVQGGTLTAEASMGTVTLTDAAGNTATVTAADIEATNGVIHVIDTVLMPAAAEKE
ncbi:fasciclin domain-containing protein [Pontixanthobacter aestiaquae]|uniref:Fasciclin domain-containing protein n=1 Tax=Pontixanthobacter aestiaquae TaxID=1509367 RepID=A0A844Z715_9SPHN|nr:fasciclin domain-containing protein [Pontixanthobacter aestiaquae]MDN3646347.1 fasciclin domain-containing protein [Pontixanthobacter aestiaquae]MXO82663.1 fasciclin domain-containing protein [Pontixanthobacter aestiaquae]